MRKFQKERLLVIAPHADDEVIGCAGLIQKVKKAGGNVYILFLAVGETKDFSSSGLSTATERLHEIENVARKLQFNQYDIAFKGNEYHLRMDTVGQQKLINLIERDSPISIEKVKPTTIAFPTLVSYNQDHQAAALATHAALRPSHKQKHFVTTVLTYENPAERWRMQQDGEANYFVRLTAREMDIKLAAMRLYKSQDRPSPNPRSVPLLKAWAKVRGGQCGSSYAEAFVAYRVVR